MNSEKNNGLLMGAVVVLLILVVGMGTYILCDKVLLNKENTNQRAETKDNTDSKENIESNTSDSENNKKEEKNNETTKTVPEEKQLEPATKSNNLTLVDKFVDKVEYNFEVKKGWQLYDAVEASSVKTLVSISNGQKYTSGSNYITLKNGVPTVYQFGKEYSAKISNVSKMYILRSGEYILWFAYLTSDGDVYVGKAGWYKDPSIDDWRLANESEINSVEKATSNNKYAELKAVSVGNNGGDTEYNHFVGITKDGKRDLIVLDYSNL